MISAPGRRRPASPLLHRHEGPEVLVAAAVAAADRTQPRVARPVLLHPRQARHQPDQPEVVVALEARVLHVRLAAGLAEPALVEGQDAVAGVQPLREGGGVLVREPPQPWLCMMKGTGSRREAPASLKIV